MGQELVEMSSKELDRLAVVRQVVEGRLTQAKAGEFVDLSERQVRRLCAAFEDRATSQSERLLGTPAGLRKPDPVRTHRRMDDPLPPCRYPGFQRIAAPRRHVAAKGAT